MPVCVGPFGLDTTRAMSRIYLDCSDRGSRARSVAHESSSCGPRLGANMVSEVVTIYRAIDDDTSKVLKSSSIGASGRSAEACIRLVGFHDLNLAPVNDCVVAFDASVESDRAMSLRRSQVPVASTTIEQVKTVYGAARSIGDGTHSSASRRDDERDAAAGCAGQCVDPAHDLHALDESSSVHPSFDESDEAADGLRPGHEDVGLQTTGPPDRDHTRSETWRPSGPCDTFVVGKR